MGTHFKIFAFYTIVLYLSACFQEATFNINNIDEGIRHGTAIMWIILTVVHAIVYAISKLEDEE